MTSQAARQISWMGVYCLTAIMCGFATVAVSLEGATQDGAEIAAEFSKVFAVLLAVHFSWHLATYNEAVRQGIKQVLEGVR